MGGGDSRKNKFRSAQVASELLVEDQEAAILVDGVFERDQRLKMCSIKLH